MTMTSAPPTILSISSQVVHSTVGNTAAMPPMQRLSVNALGLPTVLLSNHPGLGTPVRQSIEAKTLAGMFDLLMRQGWLDDCVAVYTGYFAEPTQVEAMAASIAALKSRKPGLLYFCDPVIGDDHTDLYVLPEVAAVVRERLVPIADALSPNRFELQWLSGKSVASIDEAVRVARSFPASCVLATSIPSREGFLATMAIGPVHADYVETPLRAQVPHGTGDVVAGLFLASLALGKSDGEALSVAVAGIEAVLDASSSADSLDLARGLADAERWRPQRVVRHG